MIDLQMNEVQLAHAIERARERNIIIPTLRQMANPSEIPEKIKTKLADVGLWDVNSLNLFRITWHNQPQESGGKFAGVNYLVLPPELTGIKARIVAVAGKWFPTGYPF